MQRAGLLQKVQQKVRTVLNGYIHTPSILDDIENYIVAPSLGTRSGMLGAVALAKDLGK